MKPRTKKLLSLLVTFAMLIGMMPMVYADETTSGDVSPHDADSNVYYTAAEVKTGVVTTSEDLVKAIADAKNGDTITLGEGNFTTYTYKNTSPGKSLTFVGSGKGTVWTIGDLDKHVSGESNGEYSFDGCDTITFKDMTLTTDNDNYRGFIRINNTIVENCVINGKTHYWGYKTAKFTNCTFNAPGEDYAIWDYSSPVMTFDGCTFNIAGKAVNAYVDQINDAARQIIMKDCTVNSTKANKAVLNLKNAGNRPQAWNVEISNTTVNGLDVNPTTGSALYQVEAIGAAGKDVLVKIDGKTVWNNDLVAEAEPVAKIDETTYTSLQEAFTAAKNGQTVKLLTDVEQNAELIINTSITLDLNGKTIYNTTPIWYEASSEDEESVVALLNIEDGANVTITGNGTVKAKADDCYDINIENGNLTIENGEYVGNVSAVQVHKGLLTINGGTFSLLQKWGGKSTYLINCIDANWKNGTAKVAIKGGTFSDFDPSKSPEGADTSYLADGYKVVSKEVSGSDTLYTVVKDSVTAEKPTVSEDGSSTTTTVSGKPAAGESTITVDAKAAGSSTEIKSSTVTVSSGTLTAIKNSTSVETVTINTDVGTLAVSKDALSTMAGNAADADVAIAIADTTETSASYKKKYTLTATANGNDVFSDSSTNQGTVTVSVSYDGSNPVVYYVNGETSEKMPSTYKDGILTWTTTHFSDFEVQEEKVVTDVAQVTTKAGTVVGTYSTLQEAVSAAKTNYIVKMLANVELSEPIAISNSMTLDLKGYTISAPGRVINVNTKNCRLTIQDSTATQPTVDGASVTGYSGGKIIGTKGYVTAISVVNGGSLTLKSGMVQSVEYTAIYANGNCTPNSSGQIASNIKITGGYVKSQEYGIGVAGIGASLNVSGGVIEAMDNAAVAGNGTNDSSAYMGGTTITISGGKLVSHIQSNGFIACGVYHPQVGKLNISGGSIYADGGVGILMRGGTLNMTGGTVTATGTTGGKVGDSNVIAQCYGVYVDGSASYYGATEENFAANISGTAAVMATDGVPALNLSSNSNSTSKGSIVVSGGTFSSAVDASYCPYDFTPADNGDDTYGVSKNPEAMIGNVQYGFLQDAVKAAKTGETIMLMHDVDLDALGVTEVSTYGIKTSNVTLDLGGYTLSSSSRWTLCVGAPNWTVQNGTIKNTDATSKYGAVYIMSASSTTFKNVKIESAATGIYCKIATTANIVASITIEDNTVISGGTYGIYMGGPIKPYGKTTNGKELLTVNGGSISGDTAGIAIIGAGSGNTEAVVSATINGGTISSSKGFAIAGNGKTAEPTTIIVNGGTITSASDDGAGIYHPQNGTLTITGGSISGAVGVQMCAGSLSISGEPTITATQGDKSASKTGDGSISDGAAISIVGRTGYADLGTVEIKGGTFKSEEGTAAIKAYEWSNNTASDFDNSDDTVSVSGGTFSSVPKNIADLCADGFTTEVKEDGTVNVTKSAVAEVNNVTYTTLKDAVAAANDGDTVTLLANVDLDEQIALSKAITIDGQKQYTIKAMQKIVGASGKAGMFYRTTFAQGTLTFLNVTLDGNGVSKIFLNEGGAGETVFDGVTSTNGGGIAYGSGIHISGGGSHATIKNSTLIGSTGTMELNEANYYAANDLWVGGNVYVTVENSTIGNVFVNSAPSATATNGVVHGQLTVTGEDTMITYLSGEEESVDKVDKFGNSGSLVKIEAGEVGTIVDKGSYSISGGTFKTEVKNEWCAIGYEPTKDEIMNLYIVEKSSKQAHYIDADGKAVYGDFLTALNTAKENSTITLVNPVNVTAVNSSTGVVIQKGYVVDMNGQTLTSSYVILVNGDIKDSTDGSGLIKLSGNFGTISGLQVQMGNSQMTVYDSDAGGYRLFNCSAEVKEGTVKDVNGKTTASFDFRFTFTNSEAYKLLAKDSTEAFSKLTVKLKLTWGNQEYDFKFTPSMWAEYAGHMVAGENYGMYLDLFGLSGVAGETIVGTPSLNSETGAVESGSPISCVIPKTAN